MAGTSTYFPGCVSLDSANAATRSYVVQRYDLSGRQVFTSYPVGTLTSINDNLTGTRTTYDALGRVMQVQQDNAASPGGAVLTSSTQYLAGYQTQVTNPRGFQTTTSYQAFDQPGTDAPTEIFLPEGVKTTIARDVFGKPKSVTRAGTYAGNTLSAVRSYVYDANERLCETIEPESGTTILAYDAASNIDWSADGQVSTGVCSTDRGNVAAADQISRTYDAMNRELTRTTPAGTSNTTTSYYPDGKVNTLTTTNPGSNTVTTTYTYNQRRLLTKEVLQVNTLLPWTFDYAYNSNGHLSSQTYPGSLVVGYAPDGLGRPTQAGTFASNVTYYPNGAMSGFTYGNGITHAMTQNYRQLPARSLDSYVSGGITTKVLDDSYTYDANGNVLSLSDASNAAAADNRSWGVLAPTLYDGLDRLTSVRSTNQWGSLTGNYNAIYSYDPLDNLRSNRLGASVLSYGYNANNQLATLTYNGGAAQAVSTDARGNITANAYRGQSYTFDLAHRMSQVNTLESYLYDGNGRRVRTTNLNTGTIEYFGYGQDGRLLQDWSNRRGVRNGYIYLGNTLVGLYEVTLAGGAVNARYKHTDALGSPVVTTDASKAILNRTSYTPYGAPTAPVDGVGYTGHFIDVGTGLTYMQQRYYDPIVGRFISADPVAADNATGANFNRYWYANNNPNTNKDIDGRICVGQTSEYCDRSGHYDELDAKYSGGKTDTTYFGAVSDMTENLANMDLPGGKAIAGVNPEADNYLNALSQGIADFNDGQAAKIDSGQIKETGRALDLRLVKDEQSYIQKALNGLQASNPELYRNVISTMNTNANRSDLFGSMNSVTDPNIARAANMARAELGRAINFGSEADRNVMGKYMTEVRRSSP